MLSQVISKRTETGSVLQMIISNSFFTQRYIVIYTKYTIYESSTIIIKVPWNLKCIKQ